ncbi:DUF4112 domain-containing protein [candidate division FCPU426 bacterium]|nr:DUF4112 domain-containing protein [candidate division FCPU426 bacterium]
MPMKQAASAPEMIRRRLESMAYWLDDRFTIPGTRIKVGLDALLGLIPLAGDVLTALAAGYVFWQAWRNRVGWKIWLRMCINILLDLAAGALPVLGDIADVFFRSNRKNVKLILRELDKQQPPFSGNAKH